MTKNIGFIGGGQMAEAIIKGLLQSNLFSDTIISVYEPLETRCNYLSEHYTLEIRRSPEEVCTTNEVILLAVKPQVMPEVLTRIKTSIDTQLLVTIAAGLPVSYYTKHLANESVSLVRVMPNMPALIQQGASALCKNEYVSDPDYAIVESLFKTIGTTVTVPEYSMDAVTGLSGSGPAYVLSFIEALIDGGVKIGLSRDVARNLALQTISGAVELTKQSQDHPAILRDKVTSPGGTTASGLHVLETKGFSGIVMSAVEAAYNRSLELGKRT